MEPPPPYYEKSDASGSGEIPGDVEEQGGASVSSPSNKINSLTPFTTHRSETLDTLDTSEFDSPFGERQSSEPLPDPDSKQDKGLLQFVVHTLSLFKFNFSK